MTETAATIWRDHSIDGVAASGAHEPVKREIREWGAYLEELATLAYTSGRVYTSRVSLFADLAHDAHTSALVIGDPNVNFDGLYMKNGASGAGSWTRVTSVPGRQILRVFYQAGTSTANAVNFVSSLTPPSAMSAIFLGTIGVANTGAMTFSINDATAKPVLTASGQALQAGYLPDGIIFAFLDDGTSYRLLSDVASAAIQAAAEAAAASALAAVPTLQFGSIAALRLLSGETSATQVYVAGYYAGSRCGGGPFELDEADTTTADNGGSVIVDAEGRRWKRLNQTNVMNAHDWGCIDDGDWRGGLASPTGTDNYARIMAMIAAVPQTLAEVDGYLSDAEGSWGAIGAWATVGGARIYLPRSNEAGRTGIFGVLGTIVRPVGKGLVFYSDDYRTAALLSLNTISDWTESNYIVDFSPSSAIYSAATPPLATGNNNNIGVVGLAFLRGSWRNTGNNGHAQYFAKFGVYGAPGNGLEVIDGSDIYEEDWLFPGTHGGTWTVIDNTTSRFRIQYSTGDASGLEVEFVSTGSDFTYSGTTPTAGTFDRVNIYQAFTGNSGALIGLATGSTSDLVDFDDAGLKATFAGTFYNGDGTLHADWAGLYRQGVNNVHAVYEHFEIAHCYRGIAWFGGTFLLLRVRDFTIRAIADTPLTIDGFGFMFENGQLMGVISDNAPMLHLPCVRHALAYGTLDNINFGSEGGDTGTPYFNEPDANDDWWGGTPADGDGVGTDWKYHPAKTSVLVGPRDPLTGDVITLSSAPSGSGVAAVNFMNCTFGGTSSGSTDYAFEIAVGGIEHFTFERNSFGNYQKGLFNESAVAAGHAPAVNCVFAESNSIDGSNSFSQVPAGKAPLFSEGGQGWSIPGRSARSVAGRYGRRKMEPMNAAVQTFSGSQWSKNGVTATQGATDRDGTAQAWTIAVTHETVALLQTNFSGTPGTVESGPACLELWAKQGTGGTGRVYWKAQHTNAIRYTQQWGLFIPDTVWRKFVLPIVEVKPNTIPAWVLDFRDYDVGETLILGGDVSCWKGTDDPPLQPIFYSTTTHDYPSIASGASNSVILTTGLEHIIAGDLVVALNHNLDLGTFPLSLRAEAEAGGVRVYAYNGTAGALNPGSITITVGAIPKKRFV